MSTTTITLLKGRSDFVPLRVPLGEGSFPQFLGGSFFNCRLPPSPLPAIPPNFVKTIHIHGVRASDATTKEEANRLLKIKRRDNHDTISEIRKHPLGSLPLKAPGKMLPSLK